MTSTIDPLIRFKPSEDLSKFVEFLKDSETNLPRGIKDFENVRLLTVEDIRWIYDRRHRIKDSSPFKDVHFYELIENCQMVLPEPKFPPRNPELEARIKKLRAQQEEREYRQMTKNVDGHQALGISGLDEPIGKQLGELNNYLLIILQFVISIVCSFAFGYMMPLYLQGIAAVGTRLLTGIICAFVVAVADLYFVVKFLLESEGIIETNTIKVFDNQFPVKNLKKLKSN